jgi:hypothetical protein
VCCPCKQLAVGLVVGAIAAHLYFYPSQQRCPPEGDRFHDHCVEGRKHYVLKLDWTCLGERRAEVMRMALSLPSDGKPLVGVGEVPSWLTDENADVLRHSPCINGVRSDMVRDPCASRSRALLSSVSLLMTCLPPRVSGCGFACRLAGTASRHQSLPHHLIHRAHNSPMKRRLKSLRAQRVRPQKLLLQTKAGTLTHGQTLMYGDARGGAQRGLARVGPVCSGASSGRLSKDASSTSTS